MTLTTWDPSNTGGWRLSNGNLTATSPNNDTMANIYVAFGTTPVPDNAKTYFEYQVSGARIQTAFTVGFGVHGFDPTNKNIAAEGMTVPDASFLAFSYNLTVTNSGNVIYDPQGNATRTPAQGPAPNQWTDGSIIGVLVDRINDTVQFTLNGAPQGGPFDIAGLGNKTVYPFTDSWFRSGPVATINGGNSTFAETKPTGFIPLDSSSGTGNPVPVTIGSGPNKLALQVSEDAYQGNAQFTIAVDGRQIGGTLTATASHSAGQTQTFTALGSFAPGNHTTTVDFLNDAYGGTSTTDRNLYVTGATIDNRAVSGASLNERSAGPQSFGFAVPGSTGPGQSPTVTVGSGPDTLALQVSEDAFQGDAQFIVSVDGKQIGGTLTATASHAAGQKQTFNVLGTFAAGSHTAAVNFLNDAYGGSSAADRNLYILSATIDNSVVPAATISEKVSGPQHFTFLAPGNSGSGSANAVTVNQPASLQTGLQIITGIESDPSQSIFLDWRTVGTPALTDGDWVTANVGPSGAFSADVTIDNPGTTSSMYYRVGSGPAIAAWSGNPS